MHDTNVLKLVPKGRDRGSAPSAGRCEAKGEIVIFPGLDVARIVTAWAFWMRTGRTYKD
jgi:hypothetical protein